MESWDSMGTWATYPSPNPLPSPSPSPLPNPPPPPSPKKAQKYESQSRAIPVACNACYATTLPQNNKGSLLLNPVTYIDVPPRTRQAPEYQQHPTTQTRSNKSGSPVMNKRGIDIHCKTESSFSRKWCAPRSGTLVVQDRRPPEKAT